MPGAARGAAGPAGPPALFHCIFPFGPQDSKGGRGGAPPGPGKSKNRVLPYPPGRKSLRTHSYGSGDIPRAVRDPPERQNAPANTNEPGKAVRAALERPGPGSGLAPAWIAKSFLLMILNGFLEN